MDNWMNEHRGLIVRLQWTEYESGERWGDVAVQWKRCRPGGETRGPLKPWKASKSGTVPAY